MAKYQNLGGAPPGPGMPFLDSNTCAEGVGGNLFLPGFSSLHDDIHGWMTRRMDGWTGHVMKKVSRKMTTTSFTVYNVNHFFFVPKILQKYENKKGNILLQYSSFFLFCKIFQIWEKIKKALATFDLCF
jgi:hypothetical protein